MLHNNEQCHRKETDGCGELAHRQTPDSSQWCGECAAFTGLQHCGLPRSPSPPNSLPASTAPSGNAWRTSRQHPIASHSPFTPPPSTALSDVFPSQPASLTFCSIKNRHPFPNDDFSSTIFFKQPSKTWSPHSPKPLLFLFYFIPDFIQIFFQKSRHIHSQPLNISKLTPSPFFTR